MQRSLLITALAVLGVFEAFGQYPFRTIREIQEVSLDSLRTLDTLQRTNLALWTKQRSPYYRDTVRTKGVCVVPARVIGFTASGYNLLIADPNNTTSWGGLFVRPNLSTGSPDTLLAIQWGITNVTVGDTVELTGYIDEFPAGDPVSATQIVPLYSQPLSISPGPGPSAIPPHVPKLASDFYKNAWPSGFPDGIQFTTGEPMEFMRVRMTNLTVVGYTNQTNGTLNLLDQFNNSISTMDASKWFTLRFHREPTSTYVLPSFGTRIDTIWGYIMTNSGQEASRGYRIAPLYPGDIKYGVALPQITTHRRNPVVVPPDSTPTISCRVTRGGSGISAVQLRYSVNNALFVNVNMALNSADTTYRAQIPQQTNNSFVRYFIQAVDSLGNAVKYASSALDGTASDTLRGFFFYNVLNRALTIQDIQTTPYLNGRTPYLGATVSVRGIITADTANLVLPPTRFRGTNAWYLQSGNQPWSGIWVHNDSLSPALLSLRNGDSVTVTGVVAEDFDVTRIERLSTPPVVVHTTGNALPAPISISSGTIGPAAGNGTPSAERLEGMLVQLNNVVLTDSAPTFQEIYEFAVDDGSGPVLVRRDGKHNYTTVSAEVPSGKILIRQGSRISFLRGIVYYSGNRYKLVPRTNADFGTITNSVEIEHTQGIADRFSLAQNYPNPFNPTTTIEYNLPKSEFVTVKIFNLLGQELETLVNEQQGVGKYTLRFDASRLTTGVYFYRLQAGSFTEVRKMLLVK